MKSELAKVLHAIGGRSLLGHVLAAAAPLGARRTVVVVGHGREQVIAPSRRIDRRRGRSSRTSSSAPATRRVLALDAARELAAGTVLVVPGDTPLLPTETLELLDARHSEVTPRRPC